MSFLQKTLLIGLGIFLFLGDQDAFATIGDGKPAPAYDPAAQTSTNSNSSFGNFEVGLPGNQAFSKGDPVSGALYSGTPIKDLVNLIVTFALGILVIIGVITIVIGGYMYMTAGGNASQVGTAKEMIYSALVGIFIAFISVVLLNSVNKFLGSSAVEPSLAPAGSGAPAK